MPESNPPYPFSVWPIGGDRVDRLPKRNFLSTYYGALRKQALAVAEESKYPDLRLGQRGNELEHQYAIARREIRQRARII